MKQKQIKASPKMKKQTKKSIPPKKFIEPVEESEEEEEEVKVVKKPVKRNAGKVPKVSLKKPVEDDDEDEIEQAENDEEEEAENDEEEQEEDDEDNASDEDLCEDDEEKEDDKDIEAEENEEDENEDDENEEDEENDDAPSEEAIEKEEPTIPSKVKIGPIHPSVPSDRIVILRKLPKKCTTTDIVEAFGKFGAIDQIHIISSPNSSSANVAFKTAKAALAAAAQHRKITIHDKEVWLSMKKEATNTFHERQLNSERTVYVKNLKNGTTEEELRRQFEACGEIEAVILKSKPNVTFAFITFKNKSSIPEALERHNSLLNGVYIRVAEYKIKQESALELSDQFTIKLSNKQQFESIDAKKLEKIFSNCGEISNINLECKKNVLAFINFKTEEAVKKALELNGKTEEGIELDVALYDPVKRWTTIHVSNLPKGCTAEDLINIFKRAGEIQNVDVKKNFAVIRFRNSDGYCKSFLYNESYIKGHPIFVEPHSFRKQTAFKSKMPFQKKAFKRPAANGSHIFASKKPKNN